MTEPSFTSYAFGGRAGELNRAGATASLIIELGDNYATYHAQIAADWKRLGGPPDPKAFRGLEGLVEYSRAFAQLQHLVYAEIFLRQAYGYRRLGWRLDVPPSFGPALVDESGALTSAEVPV